MKHIIAKEMKDAGIDIDTNFAENIRCYFYQYRILLCDFLETHKYYKELKEVLKTCDADCISCLDKHIKDEEK